MAHVITQGCCNDATCVLEALGLLGRPRFKLTTRADMVAIARAAGS
jgi:hypothetical protein